MKQPPPVLLTVNDIARMLSISTRTVRRLVASGHLPPPVPLRVQTKLWDRETLLAFIRDLSQRSAEAAGYQPPGPRLAQDAPPLARRGCE